MATLISKIFRRRGAANVNENPESSLSQKARILKDLQKGYAITPIDALNNYGTMRLGARIADLKKENWPIESKFVTTNSGKRVKAYYLPAK